MYTLKGLLAALVTGLCLHCAAATAALVPVDVGSDDTITSGLWTYVFRPGGSDMTVTPGSPFTLDLMLSKPIQLADTGLFPSNESIHITIERPQPPTGSGGVETPGTTGTYTFNLTTPLG